MASFPTHINENLLLFILNKITAANKKIFARQKSGIKDTKRKLKNNFEGEKFKCANASSEEEF